jgi:CRISPR/Cas system endoribonuclease Cas6 (RAMP superfamily)
MKILLSLKAIRTNDYLFPNYNYSLSSAIYNLLKFGTSGFSIFQSDIDNKSAEKTYKLFSSTLCINKFKINNEFIWLLDPNCNLIISSPLVA